MSQVYFFDEGDARKLGISQNLRPGEKPKNNLEHASTMYKNLMTEEESRSKVLMYDDKGNRHTRDFITVNDMVHVHCMNHYADMADAMKSRFIEFFFPHMKRIDRELSMAFSGADPAKADAALDAQRTLQYLYYRQVQFETMQYVGILTKFPDEGWATFEGRFRNALQQHYPGAVKADMGRRMEDAKTLVNIFMNFYAVFMVFAHSSSPYRGTKDFSYEMFLECEKFLVPSEATYELIMSMMEESFFPTPLKTVMAAIRSRWFSDLAAEEEREPTRAQRRGDEISEVAVMTRRPWRAKRNNDPEAPREETLIPPVTSTDGENLDMALCYVKVVEKTASSDTDLVFKVAAEIHSAMYRTNRGSNYEPMDLEHVTGALRDLLTCQVTEETYDTPHTVAKIFVDEAPRVAGMDSKRAFCVSKRYLDMLANDELNVGTVFHGMLHRHSVPGTRLRSAPYRIPNTRQVLPQFAEACEVPLHTKECAVLKTPEWRSKMEGLRMAASVAGLPYDVECSSMTEEILRKCTCFRRVTLMQASGPKIGHRMRMRLERRLGMPVTEMSTGSGKQIDETIETSVFKSFFTDKLHFEEAEIKNMTRYHPSLGMGIFVDAVKDGCINKYPETAVEDYLKQVRELASLSLSYTESSLDMAVGGVDADGGSRTLANTLRDLSTDMIPTDHAEALKKVREMTISVLGERDITTQYAANQGISEIVIQACADQLGLPAASKAAVMTYFRRMNDAQRRVWIVDGYTPVAGIDVLLGDIQRSLKDFRARMRR